MLRSFSISPNLYLAHLFTFILVKTAKVQFFFSCTCEPCIQGAVGLAIWVPSVTNQTRESDTPDTRNSARGYSSVSHAEDNDEGDWRQGNNMDGLELRVIEDATDLEANDEELLLENLKVGKAFSYFLLIIDIIPLLLLTMQPDVDFLSCFLS